MMSKECPKCGYVRRPTDTAPDYECPSCGVIYAKFDPKIHKTQIQPVAFCMSTTHTVPNRSIDSVIGVLSAQCVFGMNVIKDALAGIVDLTGGRSNSVQNTLKDASKTALAELRRDAQASGADAVVGVSVNFNELSGGGKSMIFAVATGTAVKLAPPADSKTESSH